MANKTGKLQKSTNGGSYSDENHGAVKIKGFRDMAKSCTTCNISETWAIIKGENNHS